MDEDYLIPQNGEPLPSGAKGRAKGGVARANALTPEERKEIAKKGAIARWGAPALKATHKGSFKEDFGADVECYVLNDEAKTAVISQRGMAKALGFSEGGDRFLRFINGKVMSKYAGPELLKRIENPFIFQWQSGGPEQQPEIKIHGYDASILIDVCRSIITAESEGSLRETQKHLAKQAHVVISASAKAGIQGLVYALSGYDRTKEEVISAFKAYIQEEAKKYEQEFPNELYMQWHRIYQIPVLPRGKSWHFKHLTVNHIYYPLAKSNGRLLELIRALKAKDGDRQKKLFQFLNELGARALRIQLGRVLEMAESSSTREEYDQKILTRFGDQKELDLVIAC